MVRRGENAGSRTGCDGGSPPHQIGQSDRAQSHAEATQDLPPRQTEAGFAATTLRAIGHCEPLYGLSTKVTNGYEGIKTKKEKTEKLEGRKIRDRKIDDRKM